MQEIRNMCSHICCGRFRPPPIHMQSGRVVQRTFIFFYRLTLGLLFFFSYGINPCSHPQRDEPRDYDLTDY